MMPFVRNVLRGAFAACLCHGAAIAADLSVVGQWVGKYPFDKVIGGKPLWAQPGVQAAMRTAMGKRYYALSQREMHGPESPVESDGQGHFAAWSCKAHDCGDNQMTVFFDTTTGSVQVCWRSRSDGKVQGVWLANGNSRPLPVNACESSEDD